MPDIIAYVSDKGKTIAKVRRDEAHRRGLLHREVDIVVINRHGLLLGYREQRSQWCFIGGHVQYGESCKDAAIREFQEEAGYRLHPGELAEATEYRRCTSPKEGDINNRITTVFVCVKDIALEELTEGDRYVTKLKYFTKPNVDDLKKNKKIMKGTIYVLDSVPIVLGHCLPSKAAK